MGWNTDQPPISYLKRRIIYYKKKRGSIKNLVTNKSAIARYGKPHLNTIVTESLKRIDKRIKEFKSAIRKLEK